MNKVYKRKIFIQKNGKISKPFMGITSNRKAILNEKMLLAETWNLRLLAAVICDINFESVSTEFEANAYIRSNMHERLEALEPEEKEYSQEDYDKEQEEA